MSNIELQQTKWNLELEYKPDFEKSMERIYAWYQGEIIDRVPVRFSNHNAEYDNIDVLNIKNWKDLKGRWFDEEYQVEKYIKSLKHNMFQGETFPVYWPNLGPNVYAGFYGCELEFGEVTSWAEPCINDNFDLSMLKLSKDNEYFKKLESMTRLALEKCPGKFMVGYTDLHPGMDCVAAWRGTENVCYDLYDNSDEIKGLLNLSVKDFSSIYRYFDSILKANEQLSVTWLGIPSFGRVHVPCCDFSAMISNKQFEEFCLPAIYEEMKEMTHNVFHLDGKDVAKHIDIILSIPQIQAIQWVNGVGDDKPVMQWIPLIKKIQAAGKSVVIDLDVKELDSFIGELHPEGLLLCLSANDPDEQERILKRVAKW